MNYGKNLKKNNTDRKKYTQEYSNYYECIEQQIPKNIKNVLDYRHDTHIVKSYFQEKDYVMELEEKIWGKAYIIFQNAKVMEGNIDINNNYWLKHEIYIINEKYKIQILFDNADIIIKCDDINIKIEEKEYFKELYMKKNNNINLANENKKDIADVVGDKSFACGYNLLNEWEKIVISFIQIYSHIKNYKYNNIEELLQYQYYNLSNKEKEKIYKSLLSDLERNLINCINVLDKYKNEINNKELNNIVSEFLEVYNRKEILLKNKNQLYLNLCKQNTIDFNEIYRNILEYIYNNFNNLIKSNN